MDATLPEDQRLIGISPKAYEHPADRAATAALHSVPMLDTVVRRLIEYGYERALRQELLSGSVRLGPDQLPEVWASHKAALARLDIAEVPDLYLTQFPITNAAAIGSGKPDGADQLADRRAARRARAAHGAGHEAGHILSDHVLYRTALMILLSLSAFRRLPVLAGLPLLGVRLALLEWFRAAELSCDRAGTLVNRDPLVTCRTLMVLAGRRHVAQAQPQRVHPPGRRVRRPRLELRPRLAPADRAGDDPRAPRPPGQRGHEVGALRRVRPDRARRLPAARGRETPARRRPRPSTSTSSASGACSRTPARAWRRPPRRRPRRPRR